MQSKVIGMVLGVAGVLLWFMPWVSVHFGMVDGYQTGATAGGVTYLWLLACIAYAVLSWREEHRMRAAASIAALGVSGLAMVQVGESAAWGLVASLIVATVSLGFAAKDERDAANQPRERQVRRAS